METPRRPDDKAAAGQGRASSPNAELGADAPRIETNLSDRTLVYSSVVAFLAWVFSGFLMFGTRRVEDPHQAEVLTEQT